MGSELKWVEGKIKNRGDELENKRKSNGGVRCCLLCFVGGGKN